MIRRSDTLLDMESGRSYVPPEQSEHMLSKPSTVWCKIVGVFGILISTFLMSSYFTGSRDIISLVTAGACLGAGSATFAEKPEGALVATMVGGAGLVYFGLHSLVASFGLAIVIFFTVLAYRQATRKAAWVNKNIS